MVTAAQLFSDDLHPGFRFRGRPVTLTESHFSDFSTLTGDKHPIHYDADYAAKSRFGRPVAHGLLLAALTALGATDVSRSLEDAMIALLEQRTRFLLPVFVGDVVLPEFEVESNDPTSSGSSARVAIAVRIVNQKYETVLEGRHVYLLRRRAGPA